MSRIMNQWVMFRAAMLCAVLLLYPLHGYVQKSPHKPNAPEDWFQIVVLPDTQCYTSGKYNGTMEMFEQQINWIKENQINEKIAYVVHLGDVSQNGENELIEWERARQAMYRLEEPTLGLPEGIPYGVAVGNHDTTPIGMPLKMKNGFQASFGRSHFVSKSYYGGSIKDREENDCHYDLFTAGGQKFIAVYLAFNQPSKKHYSPEYDAEMFEWAEQVLTKNKDRKAIVVCHSLLGKPTNSTSDFIAGDGMRESIGKFTSQGKIVYNFMKDYPNVFMMLCGHVSGEGYRIDRHNGRVIKTYLADYSSRRNPPYTIQDSNGGNGLMRVMKIDTKQKTLEVRTVAPRKDGNHIWENDADSKFTHALYK